MPSGRADLDLGRSGTWRVWPGVWSKDGWEEGRGWWIGANSELTSVSMGVVFLYRAVGTARSAQVTCSLSYRSTELGTWRCHRYTNWLSRKMSATRHATCRAVLDDKRAHRLRNPACWSEDSARGAALAWEEHVRASRWFQPRTHNHLRANIPLCLRAEAKGWTSLQS